MSTESFLAKLEKNSTLTFLLPTLQEEITYRKMDVIEASINNSMPNFIASKVLDSMRSSISGETVSTEIKDLKNDDVRDLLVRATEMWKRLVTEPKLNDEQLVSVPSQDRLAWFMDAITQSQKTETERGGVLNADEVATFPRKRRSKRNT